MTIIHRNVCPEWLDEMSPLDARALNSRRDLRRLNFWMGNARIMADVLSGALPGQAQARVIDLGAGDGSFLLRAARACRCRCRIQVDLVDRHPTPSAQCLGDLEKLGWKARVIASDVFEWLDGQPRADAIVSNLFLHHFEGAALGRLLELAAQRCRVFVACEPRRGLMPLIASRLLLFAGCNAVTRHDAPISVRAGFRDHELSAQWPNGDWRLREEPAGLFTHLFVAEMPARSQ
jgi:hypothetical protein